MAKLPRVLQRLFGSTAGGTEIGQFGSLAAASPATTSDPAVMQSLSNWLGGWDAAIIGSNSPCIEDMNAVCFVFARQLAYIFENGVPEWDATTTYYIGALVSVGGTLYQSLTNTNLNNATTDTTNWKVQGANTRVVTGTDSATSSDDILLCDASSGSFVQTLPTSASMKGRKLIIKATTSGANYVAVVASGAELIDFANAGRSLISGDSVTYFSTGALWYVI